jgi:hypothetical protein
VKLRLSDTNRWVHVITPDRPEPLGREGRSSGMMGAMAKPDTPSTEEPAHDVLAAEEFAMPAPDPPHAVPEDPSGIPEPHDVLAAEEYPLGGGDPAGSRSLVRHPDGGIRRGVLLAAIALSALMALQRLKRGRA